jgi:hypothetical protein
MQENNKSTYDILEREISGRSEAEIKMLCEELRCLSKQEVCELCVKLMNIYLELGKKYAPQKREVRIAKIKWKLACAEFRRHNAIELGIAKEN